MAQVWRDIDRAAFAENAILLELKSRAQGKLTRVKRDEDTIDTTVAEFPFMSEAFLDDIALVAAGPGGKQNVTAACAEADSVDNHSRRIVVRIARNSGTTPLVIKTLQNLFEDMVARTKKGIPVEDAQQRILSTIVQRCSSRLRKHVTSLSRLSRMMRWSEGEAFSLPQYDNSAQHFESQHDIDLLGTYSKDTHYEFARLQQARLTDIAIITSRLSDRRPFSSKTADIVHLTKLTYLIRRSSLVQQIIKRDLLMLQRQQNNIPKIEDILQRFGQFSKFARAAYHMEKLTRIMTDLGLRLEIEGTPSPVIRISELSHVTPRDIRLRGGRRFQKIDDQHLEGMIKRWPNYREHAEIQLIMFYEEHPEKKLVINYIGCDKLSCYLCFHFMEQHGGFRSGGCHQSLYSLWAVREIVHAGDVARGETIRQALFYLSELLESKIQAQKREGWRGQRLGTGPESIADLSRVSLPLSELNFVYQSSSNPRETVVRGREIKGVLTNDLPPLLETVEATEGIEPSEDGLCTFAAGAKDKEVDSTSINPISPVFDSDSAETAAILRTGPQVDINADIDDNVDDNASATVRIANGSGLSVYADRRATQQSCHLQRTPMATETGRRVKTRVKDGDRKRNKVIAPGGNKTMRPSDRSLRVHLRRMLHLALDILFGKEVRERVRRSSSRTCRRTNRAREGRTS